MDFDGLVGDYKPLSSISLADVEPCEESLTLTGFISISLLMVVNSGIIPKSGSNLDNGGTIVILYRPCSQFTYKIVKSTI